MKWNTSVFLLLLCSVIFLISCEKSLKPGDSSNNNPENSEKTIKSVESIKINEAPKNSKTPSEAIAHQFEVIFEDGSTQLPTENDIISETIIGNQGILTIHSPEGVDVYASFLYHMEDEWILDGILRVSAIGDVIFKEKEGLYLPMEEFNHVQIKVEANPQNKESWVFVDQKNVISITRMDGFAFVENSYIQKVRLTNENEAYISKDNYENYFLYYYDTEKIIIVSGNIKDREEVIKIANSLPSVTNPSFPAITK